MSTLDQAYSKESPSAKDRRPNHWDTPVALVFCLVRKSLGWA